MRYWICTSKVGFRVRKRECPQCHKKRLNPYFDRRTNEVMPDPFGKCERVNSCQYDANPNYEIKDTFDQYVPRPLPPPVERKNDYRVPQEAFDSTFKDHSGNNLFKWMKSVLDPKLVEKVLLDYRVGTYTGNRKDWHGSTMFWLISAEGIHTGHAIQYNEDSHRRKDQIDNLWTHNALTGKSAAELGVGDCFFGQHLLALHPDKVVGIVESEKTALICAVLYPGMVWLATGGEHKLSWGKVRFVKGRWVCLYPDIGPAFKTWSKIAQESDAYFLTEGGLVVNDILEVIAYPEDVGKDLGDFLIPNFIEDNDLDIMPCFPQEVIEAEEVEEVNEVEVPGETPKDDYPPVIRRMIEKNANIAAMISLLDLDMSNVTIK